MIALIIKDLNAMIIVPFVDNDLFFRIDSNPIRIIRFTFAVPFLSKFANEVTIFIKDLNTMIPESVMMILPLSESMQTPISSNFFLIDRFTQPLY